MHIRIREGLVQAIKTTRNGYTEVLVDIGLSTEKAINYDELTGPIHPGDRVILNTTAVHKGLGTGGMHFVMANASNHTVDIEEPGHIMKLRYTPSQVKVLSVEEKDHPLHSFFENTKDLNGIPVIIGTLHSMLAPAVATIMKLAGSQIKIAYLMTDGAALPAYYSNTIAELRKKNLLHQVVTCGHAFGGDIEAVNIYSGLLAAKGVAQADIIIVLMGPGIVGTNSEYGYTGTEQGEIINAVSILGGKPIAIPRISFRDPRTRHKGLSHHTKTALGKIALRPCEVVIPLLPQAQSQIIHTQLAESNIDTLHKIVEIDATFTPIALAEYSLQVSTMGRTFQEDEAFFLTAGAAGIYASSLLGFK